MKLLKNLMFLSLAGATVTDIDSLLSRLYFDSDIEVNDDGTFDFTYNYYPSLSNWAIESFLERRNSTFSLISSLVSDYTRI